MTPDLAAAAAAAGRAAEHHARVCAQILIDHDGNPAMVVRARQRALAYVAAKHEQLSLLYEAVS